MSLRYFASAAIAAVLVATGLCAQAQKTFPGKPVRMVVPFPPGQATDIVARLLADALTRAWDQQVIVAQAGAPYGSLKDLEDAAKKEPGKLNFGYLGAGTSQHLRGELFKYRAALDITGVLYKGSGPMMTDLLGGQITLAVDSLASALPQLKAGKIRAIAMTSAQRERIIERGAIPDPRGPKEFAEFVAAEIVKWGEIVRRAKLKVD